MLSPNRDRKIAGPTEAETVGTKQNKLKYAINNTPGFGSGLTPEEQAVKDALDEAKKDYGC